MFELLHREIKEGFHNLRVHLDNRVNELNKELINITHGVFKMSLDFNALKAQVQTVADNQSKLSEDQAKDASDIQAAIAKLGSITPANPADQATIDSITQSLSDIAQKQQASSAGLEQSASDLEKAIA